MKENNTYVCSDGRVRIYLKDTKQVMSYPKYLMEQALGRRLLPNEQVHHKDGNPLKNELDNLEIRLLGEHQREHNPQKYLDKMATCEWCGKEFLWTAKQQRTFYGNRNRKTKTNKLPQNPFCSKKCSGEYGAYVQNNDLN